MEQLTFYGSYHNNKWNQLIHAYFVPTIFWTVAVWMAYTPDLAPSWHLAERAGAWLPWHLNQCVLLCVCRIFSTHPRVRGVVVNGAALQCLAYWLYYITLETFVGFTWGVCVATPLWISATLFRTHVANAWAWALGVHVLSWYMQIHPGHAILEGRKPALLDSFFQV